LSLVVDEHRQYLADDVRVGAFRRAVERVVQPGAVVVDLGAGTGILGLLACRAGARRVYAIEASGMIELARAIARANGYEDRIVFVKGLSTQVDLPEQADVLIADQIGRFGFEAGLLECFADARQRFLRAGGSLIPRQVQLWVAPVERPDLADQVEFWGHRPAGFDFQPARELAVNTGYPVTLRRRELLAPAVGAADIDLATVSPGPLRLAASFEAARAGTLHGIGGWFAAGLAPGVVMTNSPLAARRINRRNVFFPVDRPVAVAAGDPIQVTLHVRPEELVVTWKVEVWQAEAGGAGAGRRTKRAEFRHSTLRGMLIAQEDLRRTAPGAVPHLAPRGEARRTVLELCDGRRSLAEIEREVQRRHPTLFASGGVAAEFVAEVVTRYAT
jgi:SAM-dependent methyltransferase